MYFPLQIFVYQNMLNFMNGKEGWENLTLRQLQPGKCETLCIAIKALRISGVNTFDSGAILVYFHLQMTTFWKKLNSKRGDGDLFSGMSSEGF